MNDTAWAEFSTQPEVAEARKNAASTVLVPRVWELADSGREDYRRLIIDHLKAEAEKPTPRKPGLVTRVGHFAGAVVRHVLDRGRIASEPAQAERRRICGACEHRCPDDNSCAQCGCPIEAKIRWASEECPAGRWAREFEPGSPAREIQDAMHRLSPKQTEEVENCPSRHKSKLPCCDSFVDVCAMGYFDGGAIMSLHCAKCRLENRPQAPTAPPPAS